MLLSDNEIRQLCTNPTFYGDFGPMIEPFSEAVSGDGIISYGLTSAGYDLRLGTEILIFKNSYGDHIDPKRFKDPVYTARMFDRIEQFAGYVSIPPNGYILGKSLEYIRIPRRLKGRCVGKSTYARSGIIVNTTPLEPEWEGYLTIEISNATPCRAVVFINEGIAQLEFEMINQEPQVSYKDKAGKYDRQVGVVPSRVL